MLRLKSMKKILALLFASILALTPLAACTTEVGNDPTQAPTAEPEAIVTDTPEAIVTDTPEPIVTDTPEPEPSASSVVYDEYELSELLKFMEAVGVISDRTNGALICPGYQADDPTTWLVEGRPLIRWTDDGRISAFYLHIGNAPHAKPLMYLGGKLVFIGFDELEKLEVADVNIDELTIMDCDALTELTLLGSEFNKVYMDANIQRLRGNAVASEFYWNCYNPDANCVFELSLAASGDGLVGCRKYLHEFYMCRVFIEAQAKAGSRFVGWYDEDGNLVSTDSIFMISSDFTISCIGTFNYTARFEKN